MTMFAIAALVAPDFWDPRSEAGSPIITPGAGFSISTCRWERSRSWASYFPARRSRVSEARAGGHCAAQPLNFDVIGLVLLVVVMVTWEVDSPKGSSGTGWVTRSAACKR